MAGRKEDYEVNLLATDKASGTVDKLTKSLEDIKDADVNITATDNASGDVDQLIQRINGLTNDEKKVILTAEARKLKAEVDSSLKLLAKVDGKDFEAVLEAKDNAKAKLDAVQTALDDLDGEIATSTLDVDDNASKVTGAVDGDLDAIDGRRTSSTLTATGNADNVTAHVDAGLDSIDGRKVKAAVDADVGAGLSGLFGSVGALSGDISSSGNVLIPLVAKAGPYAALAALLLSAANSAGETATDINNLATFAGTSTDEASRLYAVFQDNGVEAGDLMDIIGQMSGILASNPELVTNMGISMDTVRQGPVAVLIEVMSKFWADGKLSDDERIAAMALFGEEGVRQINSIATAVKGDLQTAMDNVAENRIFDEEDIANASEFNHNMQDAMGSLKSIGIGVGKPVLEVLNPILQVLAAIAEKVPAAWDVLTLDGGTLRDSDFSTEFQNFVALLQSGKEQAEAWQLAWGSMEGFDTFKQRLIDVNTLMSQGTPLVEAMGEVFGTNDDNAVALATTLGIVDSVTRTYNKTAADATAIADANAEAEAAQTQAREDNISALQDEISALEEATQAEEDKLDASRSAVDSYYAQRDATRDVADAYENINAVWEDSESTADDTQEASDALAESVLALADANVRLAEDEAARTGAVVGATEKTRIMNRTLLEQAAQMNGPGRDAVLNLIDQYEDLPDDIQIQVQTLIDQGKIDEANALLEQYGTPIIQSIKVDADRAKIEKARTDLATLQQDRTVNYKAVVTNSKTVNDDLEWLARPRTATIKAGGGKYATGTSFSNPGLALVGEHGPEFVSLPGGSEVTNAGQTAEAMRNGGSGRTIQHNYNITQNFPAGTDTAAVMRAQRRYARRNGLESN